VDEILKSISSIGTISFTGGEPTLNVPLIQYFVDRVKELKIPVSSFYLVTNGKIESIDLVKTLIDLYAISDMTDEMSTFTLSRDQYHEKVPVPKIYKALKFFNEEAREKFIQYDHVIKEGRARNIGRRNVVQEWELESYESYVENEIAVKNDMYIAANGNVVTCCDFSYKRIDRETVGNVLNEPLSQIVSRYLKAEAA
jgi:MoaA/NifB/PqqE/SkfB family radical SAM enzyme